MNEMQQPVTVSAFRPGDWFGIVGPAVSVFLPPSEKSRVGALWEIVDGGADFDEVLDTLIASGLRSLPGFLLLGSSAPDTRVVARGPARAVFALTSGEQVTVDGAEARTWNERTLHDVTRVSVLLDEDAGEPGDRSVDSGLVRVARVDRPPFPAEPLGGTPPAAAPDAAAGVEEHSAGFDALNTPVVPVAAAAPETPDLPLGDEAEATETPAVPDDTAPDDTAPDDAAPDDAAPDETVSGDAEPDAAVSDEPTPIAGEVIGDDVVGEGDEPEATVIDPTPEAETTIEEGSGDVPSWPAPSDTEASHSTSAEVPAFSDADTAPPFEAPDAHGPAAHAPSALDAPSVPGWPVPLPADAPEPSLEPPLSVGSWKRDDDPDTGAPNAFGPDDDVDAATEVFDVAEIAAEGSAAPDPVTPAPWPAPAVGGQDSQGSSEMPAWGAPAQPETPEHDGQTVSGGWDAGEFARRQPGIPGQPQAPEVTAQPVATLVFAHGEVVAVDRAVLIGRAPEARRFTSTEQPRLVTVPSPNQEISSTHLEVRPGSGADHGSAVVTDMGSTNGTVLVQPGLGPESLTPGMPVQLLPGAVIDLGDGMTIQVAGA